ncbi:Bax inhibitor-1/YccA family protein [Bacillus aquiflavi]|uniref:Bax inhibitor-1/YccA family protein n=1 Tax=Bacillus aquiflavi TaxID=2672567 RepID=A0A6B3VXR2_9BACI|nr:Bax inhibitor-1/YccA family protein [Bacillus aquiflavi]MBA4536720.1 Bax inhibitor-1/YccA family protein [Bacillus aquiflavi]NEY81087.1 Bax inhibitor-1/YccA family protein [Bacillus aquiflavi]UAC48753.1 Bax inhibitor-1/YccA family protein [Bacillus aquiflavi]
MYTQTVNEHFPSVLRTFALSLAFALLGMMAGVFVPPALFIPLAIIEVGMLIVAFMLRRKKAISYQFLFIFTFISGITTYPIVAHYMSTVGGNVVLMALGTTTTVFTGLALYASKTKRDLSFLGGMLFAALLALIAISIFNLIWPLSSTGMLAFSFIGVLVFSGYILFDFNRMKHYGVTAEEVPLMALNLYLDFINLFISILRIFGILSRD